MYLEFDSVAKRHCHVEANNEFEFYERVEKILIEQENKLKPFHTILGGHHQAAIDNISETHAKKWTKLKQEYNDNERNQNDETVRWSQAPGETWKSKTN